MIVVDSSVWIANLRGIENDCVRKLQKIHSDGDEQVLIGDLILLEVLQGARDESHAAAIERNLRRYPIASMLDASLAVHAARNYRSLRGFGVTIRKTIDMIIGTFCIARGHRLVHDDRDFEPMVTHLGLRVL